MSLTILELTVRLVSFNMFKPSSNIFTVFSKAVPLLWSFFIIYGSCLSLFVCFVALRPKSTAMVMAGRSVHQTTLFPGQG